eukprot:Clim_evm7s209 gene=Clim_evmTU7s209
MAKRAGPVNAFDLLRRKAARKDHAVPGAAWQTVEKGGCLLMTHNDAKGTKILGMDLDSTLVTTKSGKAFAKDGNDWRFLFPNTVKRLKHAVQDLDYRLVIFSNQMGVAKGKTKESDVKERIANVTEALGIPCEAIASLRRDIHRKPAPGMWDVLDKHILSKGDNDAKITADKESSIFVGDMAGRLAGWQKSKKKDKTDSDRAFAANIGITFRTPEEYFLDEAPVPFEWDSWDPTSIFGTDTDEGNMSSWAPSVNKEGQEMVLLVGLPGSGKSTMAKEHFEANGYVRVNNDTLKSIPKCKDAANAALKGGKSCVIDNTNVSRDHRGRFIAIAKEHGVSVRCIVIKAERKQCMHNNNFRELINTDPTSGKSTYERVPNMVFYGMAKSWEDPNKSEGIDQIVAVTPQPYIPSDGYNGLSAAKMRTLYRMRLGSW